MRAIEFQATAHQHTIRIPETIPDGVAMRVLLLLQDEVAPTGGDCKQLLASLAEGLGEEDLHRHHELGREVLDGISD